MNRNQADAADDDELDDDEVYNSSGDSDIQEITVVKPPNNTTTESRSLPPVKRRKSSPQMDPILYPSYTPTPLHILEQRARTNSRQSSNLERHNITYNPTPISANNRTTTSDSGNSSSRGSTRNYDDYIPLLEPSPCVVGSTTIRHVSPTHKTRQTPTTTTTTSRQHSVSSTQTRRANPSGNSASALRPVSSALAQAVARRRNSRPDESSTASAIEKDSPAKTLATPTLNTPSDELSYAEEPVMWSPQLPSQIEPIRAEETAAAKAQNNKTEEEEEYEKYTSPRVTKQRIAHRPTVSQSRQKKPRAPLGVSKKVPPVLRMKYLDVIINEYLNTGHKEEESYQEALKEELALANRAANKSIYINLVAGLKKRIREKAGISTLPQDNDPKYVNGNKVVSHSEILTGKVTGTFSIERKRKSSDPAQLNEYELYDKLSRYLVPVDQLEAYGYPCRDPDNPSLRKPPLGKDGQKQQLRTQLATNYTCERCTKVYRVDPDGLPLPTAGKCIYHPGHLWNERINRSLEKRYSCCKGDPSAGGCSSNPYHVHKGDLEIANYKGFVETKLNPERDPNKHGIYALDCEMCYTTYGLELTRVTVINHKSDVVYEKLVRPTNPILDYNTKFSGIKDGDLDYVTTTLANVQQDLLDMFSSKTILIGHSLDSDMKALRIFHKQFIDTAQLFPHKRGLPFKRALRTLMVENLRVIIQEDVGHDSKEDASAAFRLVMWKAKTDVPEKST